MSYSSKLSENFIQPVVVGLVNVAGAYAVGEGNNSARLGGMSVPLPIFLGLVGSASSIAGETLKNYVLPMLPNNAKFASLEGVLLQPALCGLVEGSALQFLTKTRFKEGFILGAGSEIAGSYLYSGVVKPYLNK